MCNRLSNLLPFKALSTSFLQRGTSFQPPKNSCPYLECFQGTFSHPWQQWQKKSHRDNHNNTFKNRVHQTCSLKKGSLHVKPTQNSKLKTAKSLALQLRSIWFPPWLPLLRQAVFCICSAHAALPCCQSQEPHTPASGKQPISGISLLGKAQLQTQQSSKLWGNR